MLFIHSIWRIYLNRLFSYMYVDAKKKKLRTHEKKCLKSVKKSKKKKRNIFIRSPRQRKKNHVNRLKHVDLNLKQALCHMSSNIQCLVCECICVSNEKFTLGEKKNWTHFRLHEFRWLVFCHPIIFGAGGKTKSEIVKEREREAVCMVKV